jgi:fructokinase
VIVVAGEALVDRVHEARGRVREVLGGGPFNTARALARLGTPVSFLGHLSSDARGQALRNALEAAGVDVSLVSTGPEPTTVAEAHLDGQGRAEYRFVVDGTAAPALTAATLPAGLDEDVRALTVGSLGLALEPIATTLASLVEREHGRRAIVVDPNVRVGIGDVSRHRSRLRSVAAVATVVKASDADLAFMEPGVSVDVAAQRVLDRGARLVVVTRGERGAFALHRDLRVDAPAMRVDVVDTIGAGDVFGAALVSWMDRHGHLRQDRLRAGLELGEDALAGALRHACTAAALACTREGAHAPAAAEVAAAVARAGPR